MGKAELLWGLVTAATTTVVLALVGLVWGDGDEQGAEMAPPPQMSSSSSSSSGRRRESREGDIEVLVGSADMLVQQGRFAEAESQYLAALEAVRSVSSRGGDGDDDAAAEDDRTALAGLILHELGSLYKFTDRLADADAAFGRSVHAFRSAIAVRRSSAASSSAPSAAAEGPLCRALCEQAEVKTLRTRLVGGGTADSNEAHVLLHDAHALAEEAVAILERRLAQRESDSGSSEGEAVEALQLTRKGLADALRSLTQVHMFTKEWTLAEATIRRSIALLQSITGGGNEALRSPAGVTARMWLSQILLGQDRPADACEVCRELAVLHKGVPEEAYFLRYLGEVLCDAEQSAESEDALQRSLALYRARTPAEEEAQGEEPGRERWAAVNDLATLYNAIDRTDAAEQMLADMRLHMRCSAPETSSRFLRTLQCGIKPVDGGAQHVLFINVLVRERHSRKVPVGSFLVFCFSAPGSDEAVPSGIEKEIDSNTKTVAVASPGFPGNGRNGGVRTIAVRVLAPDHTAVLSTHIQLVRPESDPASRLVLD